MYVLTLTVSCFRQAMIHTCRHFKDHFGEARERSSKALGFAKMLRKVNNAVEAFELIVYRCLQCSKMKKPFF
jgi:MEKK4 N-terminal